MRLVACAVPISKANSGLLVIGEHQGAMVAEHLKDVLHRFELTHYHLVAVTNYNDFPNYSKSHLLQSTLGASGLALPGLRNQIPCMAHDIQLAVG
jgi:hypothetical protein